MSRDSRGGWDGPDRGPRRNRDDRDRKDRRGRENDRTERPPRGGNRLAPPRPGKRLDLTPNDQYANLLRAGEPTLRYMRATGWTDREPLPPVRTDGMDASSLTNVKDYTYRLSPWQRKEAEYWYGVKDPGDDLDLVAKYQTGSLTDDYWAGLNEKQKNAVRFNDLLLPAVAADRALKDEEGDREYREKVAEMFGTEGGSEVYAPNTMALLEQLGMGPLRGQDLDQYLSLDRAYDAGELADLGDWDTTPKLEPFTNYELSSSRSAGEILDRNQIDYAGALINKALTDTSISGWNESSRLSSYLGIRPPVEQIPIGWLNENEMRATEEENVLEGFYQGWWDSFQSPQLDTLENFWLDVDRKGYTDTQLDLFFDYVYQRSLDADRTGDTGGEEGGRTGAQVREFLGMEG